MCILFFAISQQLKKNKQKSIFLRMGICVNKPSKNRNSESIIPLQEGSSAVISPKLVGEKVQSPKQAGDKISQKSDVVVPIQITMGEKKNKSRAGICNIGYTSSMNASLQALMSVYNDEYLVNAKGKLAIQLKKLYTTMIQKKNSVVATDFKAEFDKHFSLYKEQKQCDPYLFCQSLFQQFKQENQQLVQKKIQLKIKNINKCTKCSSSQEGFIQSLFLDVPLRKQINKQFKIDYITQNKMIQTITFNMDDGSKIGDWKNSFQKASNAKDYFLCQIDNSDIINVIDNLSNFKNQTLKSFGISNQMMITAYETVVVKSKLKLQKANDYRTYTDVNGKKAIAMVVVEEGNNTKGKPQKKSNEINGKEINEKIKVIIQNDSEFEEKLVVRSQLSNFPDHYPPNQIYIKVINYNQKEKKKIGRPFILKIPQHYPISTIREALQKCIGTDGYYLRISPINQLDKCCICNQLNETNSKCIKEKEGYWPICWVKHDIQFLVVWQDSNKYNELIAYKKQEANNQSKATIIQQYNSFNLNNIQSVQLLQVNQCNNCQLKKVKMEHQQLVCSLSEVLMLHLIRFPTNGEIKKMNTKWKLQENLKVFNENYVLVSVICHTGESMVTGHYTAVSGGVKYDDEKVSNMAYNEISPESIYMLFYVRVNK